MTPRIAVFAIAQGRVSETFIRDHIRGLGSEGLDFYGKEWNLVDNLGNPVNGKIVRAIGMAIKIFNPALSHRLWVLQTVRLLRRKKITHILAEYAVTGAYLYKVAKLGRMVLIVHFHGYDAFQKEVLDYYRGFYQEMFRIAAAIIVVSDSMRRQVIELGAIPEKIYVIPCGVNDKDLPVRKINSNLPISFAFLGRFVDKKSPDLILLSFKKLLERGGRATLTMIGGGPLLQACKRLAAATGMLDHVRFTGELSREQALQILSNCEVFLQHSIIAENGDREGTPVALIESQMLGLPCVATDHEGIAEVVLDQETGILVSEKDIDSMASAMLRLANSRDILENMGKAARLSALNRYSQEQKIHDLRNVILKTVG